MSKDTNKTVKSGDALSDEEHIDEQVEVVEASKDEQRGVISFCSFIYFYIKLLNKNNLHV
jgi:phosphoribosyl-ATP pyrophosphohydrolase